MGTLPLVIMAAGIGKRYGGLKQMAPVGPHGESIIDYSIYDALRSGFDQVVFVIRQDIEADFREKVGRTIEARVDTTYVFQELALAGGVQGAVARLKPWGTGHAVLCCRGVVDAPFAVINADDFYGFPTFRALASYLQQAKDRDSLGSYALVGYTLANTLSEHGSVARGICQVTADDYLVAIQERTCIQQFGVDIKYSLNGTDWVGISPASIASMNAWGFTPGIFQQLAWQFSDFLRLDEDSLKSAEFLLPEVVNTLVAEGKARVKVLRTDAQWFGVTYQADRLHVQAAIHELIRQEIYPEKLWNV